MKCALHYAYCMFVTILMAGCVTPRHSVKPQSNEPASPEEFAKWCDQQHLTIASEEEVKLAKQCESRWDGRKAVAANDGLRVVFKLGKLVGSGNSNLSTTSSYALLDRNNHKLAEGPSCFSSGLEAERNVHNEQRVWFAPDGKTVVIYEYVNECNGPDPLTIVFYEDKDDPDHWRSKFLHLPFCGTEFVGEDQHSTCVGIVGDELLIEDCTNDKKRFKIKIDKVKEHYPFPFTIG